jgi:hypothetical protein
MIAKIFNTIIVGSGKSTYFVADGLSWALQKVAPLVNGHMVVPVP